MIRAGCKTVSVTETVDKQSTTPERRRCAVKQYEFAQRRARTGEKDTLRPLLLDLQKSNQKRPSNHCAWGSMTALERP